MVLLGGSGLQVTDPDLNDEVKLQLLGKGSDQFSLDPETGKVFYKGGGFSQLQDNNQVWALDRYVIYICAVRIKHNAFQLKLFVHFYA